MGPAPLAIFFERLGLRRRRGVGASDRSGLARPFVVAGKRLPGAEPSS